eukprot:2689795-Amphidinium_carterae.1
MPDSSEGGIKSTTEAIFSAVGTLFQVPEALSTKAGLQTTKVRAISRHSGKQLTSGVPLDFVIRFSPSKVLLLAKPTSFSRNPGKSIRQESQMANRSSSSTLEESTVPDLGSQRPVKGPSI